MHEGRIEMEFGDGSTHELGPGAMARVDAPTVRKIKNVEQATPSTWSWAPRTATWAATGAFPRARRAVSAIRALRGPELECNAR